MGELSLDEVSRLVAAANAARLERDRRGRTNELFESGAEARLEALFCSSHRLAVYGSLAPGRSNHHVLAPLGGEWTDGWVEGELLPVGWGAALGYPAFRPRAGASAVAVQVLATPRLAAAWPDIDRFEGPEYRRVLVPILGAGSTGEKRLQIVANVYAAAVD